jgi:hypothetical protein
MQLMSNCLKTTLRNTMALLCLLAMSISSGAAEMTNYFPSFADKHTVGLWLFDESQYLHTSLTDASENEYDLRLMDGGSLVPGRFGRALQISPNTGIAVAYAGFKGAVSERYLRVKDGNPSGLWGPTVAPQKVLAALVTNNWTLEVWLKFNSIASSQVTILDLGQAYDAGVRVSLVPARGALVFENAFAGFKAVCPAELQKLENGEWHHVAFTHSAEDGAMVLFLDGKRQAAPSNYVLKKTMAPPVVEPADLEHDNFDFTNDKDAAWRQQHRFNFSIGQDRNGSNCMSGIVDELRLSDTVRYSSDFALPGGFSRNYGPHAPQPAVANGGKLLFEPDAPAGPVQLESRKHLFIDDAVIADSQNVELVCNPPTARQDLNFQPDKSAWRPGVFDRDGKVYMFIPDGYGSEEGISRLMVSEDGLNFESPKLGLITYKGSKSNNLVFHHEPMYGPVFRDLNPAAKPEEQYKLTAWVANRGIYLYLSPDGIHWRRNETCMLPLVSGGGAETYWDDQRGLYVDFIKRDSSFNTKEFPGRGRRECMFETREVFKSWPFNALKRPYFESWPMPAVTGEGPVVFAPDDNGEVYRTRAIKYPWAPDTYLAFVWRFGQGEKRQVDLGVSRDGIHWKFFADKVWYVNSGDDAAEVLSLYGLIRRGNEIWQYADYGGAHGAGKRIYARLKQRLDGFVSLDAASQRGFVTTRPLVFRGSKLTLNVAAKGEVRVAILDEAGAEITGFGLSICDPIQADSISKVVSWRNRTDVSKLSGKVVRLKFEIQDAKLFAMQFE